jgi:hypothetical protein
MKKSFLIYVDSLDILDELTPSQIANLFLAIKAHHKGEGFELDAITRVALKPFLIQWERDLERYEETCNRNKANGLKGGRPLKNPKNPVGYLETEKTQVVISKPKKADSDSDSDSERESDIKKKNKQKKIEPPTLDDVKAWFLEQGSTAEQGAKAWQYYSDGNWHDAKGSPVKNWRQKMRGGRWLEVKAVNTILHHSENGISYQNLSDENPNNFSELNDFFTAE